MLALTVLIAPALAWVWESLNRLLSGIVEPARIAWTVPVIGVLILLFTILARAVRRWTRPGSNTVGTES